MTKLSVLRPKTGQSLSLPFPALHTPQRYFLGDNPPLRLLPQIDFHTQSNDVSYSLLKCD